MLSTNKLHADDKPVPVLAPGQGKTKLGRLWTYVRDGRPANDPAPPAVWFCYSPDGKGARVQVLLQQSLGIWYKRSRILKSVSVIIPTYNYGRFIREAIDSVLAQTYHGLEIIVVDDGSTDDTQQILAGFGNRIMTVLQNNAGAAAARNAGMAVARGEYLAFLDSDDLWLPEKINKQIALFEADPELGLVHCGAERIDAAGKTLS